MLKKIGGLARIRILYRKTLKQPVREQICINLGHHYLKRKGTTKMLKIFEPNFWVALNEFKAKVLHKTLKMVHKVVIKSFLCHNSL